MKTSTTAKRLKEILDRDGLKQVDILKKAEPYCKLYDIKLTKADLSQYISGKVEPGQEKLFVLSQALDIDVAWLMGYDVEKYNNNSFIKRILTYAHLLNNTGKAEAEKRIRELTLINTYTDSQASPDSITQSPNRASSLNDIVADEWGPETDEWSYQLEQFRQKDFSYINSYTNLERKEKLQRIVDEEEIKKHLETYGAGFLLTLRDSWNEEDIPTHCYSEDAANTIIALFDGKSFEDLTDNEAFHVMHDFIYPIAYGDIKITDGFASAIKTDCSGIIKKLPVDLLNRLHNS